MRLEFSTIDVENFGSFIGKHTFQLADDQPCFNLLRGRNEVEPRLGQNGSGKSTLLNALAWCLYGKTTNDLASTDIRPWYGKGQTKVSVPLMIDSVEEKVIRTAGPNSLTLKGKTVLQADIDKRVGMSFDVFRQTILLGQGRPLFHDLPNREKLQFLSDVLDLERWDRYADKASKLASALIDKQQEATQEHGAASSVAQSLEDQLAKQKAEFDAWEQDRTSRLEAAERDVKRLSKAVDILDKKLTSISARLDMDGLILKLADTDLDKADEEYKQASLSLIEKRARWDALTKLREDAQTKLEELKVARICPSCGQPIKNNTTFLENKSKIEDAIHSYLKDASKLSIEAAKARVAELEHRRTTAANHFDSCKKAIVKWEDEKSLLINNKADEDVRLRVAKAQVTTLSASDNPFRLRLNDLKRDLKTSHTQAAEAKERCAKLEAMISRRQFWAKAFKDIRLFVLQEVLQELQAVTNNMLDTIGLVGWEVGYAIERETKAGTIQKGLITTVMPPEAKGNRPIKWSSWSGGESQRLRLAGALALSEVLLARAGIDCNIELLDEPTKGLSTEGVQDLCEFLSERSRRLGRTIWLVDHKTMESSYFDKTVSVVKDKSGSRITGGEDQMR